MCSFHQIKLQNFFHTMHHAFTTIFSKCKHATMSQKHRQGSCFKKNQGKPTHVMIKYADLIDMQIMDAVVFTYNIVTSCKQYNNWIYNIIIWLLPVHCDIYNLAIENKSILLTIYLYIANLHINPIKWCKCVYICSKTIFLLILKKSTFIFIKFTIKTALLSSVFKPNYKHIYK